MYILNYEIVEAIAKTGKQQKRLDTWLMQWFNSSDGLKRPLLVALAELYNETVGS